MEKSISVIIPTYNEKDNIVALLERLHSVLAGSKYEVIFMDDNSRDGTIELVQSLANTYPAKIIVRKGKRGLATSVADGFKYASGQIFVVMDADLQHPPEFIPFLLKAIEAEADIALASRYVCGGGVRNWTLSRRIISKGAIFLTHVFLPSTRPIKDITAGFFTLKREVVDGVELKPIGWKILLEVLFTGKSRQVIEVPFVFTGREAGSSKLNLKPQVEYLKHIFSLMRRTGEVWRFLKFCLVGGSGVVVNEGLLWILREFAGLPLYMASPIAVETSIISNFTLNDYFTFADRRTKGGGFFLRRLGKFNLVSLVGIGINTGVLLLFTHAFGWHYLLSNLVGIAVAMLWNYFINSWWTWK